MKKILILLLPLLATQLTRAQTTIAGSVKDDKGAPVPYALVLDAQNKNAALTDSVGNFNIKTNSDAKLQFAAPGYADVTLPVDKGGAGLQVVLKETNPGAANASANNVAAQVTNKQEVVDVTTMRTGGQIAPGHQKGNLVGSQYLFELFVHGFIVETSGNIVYNSSNLLDFDKVRGGLLLAKDPKSIELVDWDQVKGFTLYGPTGARYDFEKDTAISKTHFLQAVATGPKYKIYKLIKTKFVRSDYVNNGAAPHGHDYDEFVDDADYFVVDVQANKNVPLSLKKKSIKAAFAKEADKINKYLSDASGSIDDAYLNKLGAFMNQ
ncbi:MAG TPA: carboxypeptidase-like regulatory domain-containing protein [Mucilaginibacter sp.]|nr:carboxypeptidase-like regulatory domain-containing protein [Mucilaginibacter sp.]